MESTLESYFAPFRGNIIGQKQCFTSPFGEKQILYADWTATGRAYRPIEEAMLNEILPFVANTHTETTVTGTIMSKAYEQAKLVIKQHVHACDEDRILFCGSGMTSAVNKLQRILGLRFPERMMDYVKTGSAPLEFDEDSKPVVFVTHMEHHSNHISWLETIATVEIIRSNNKGNVDLVHLRELLARYSHRKNKIAAVTACSNVTGIVTPYHQVAKIIHEHNGFCFVDFACSAPYVNMDMHPAEAGTHLDAIYFSTHKFLGGPGTPGVLIFHNKLYKNAVPDQPGGGTIRYSNPWKVHEYTDDIEQREDGGTPPFLMGIKAAMCIRLKNEMGTENILRREREILDIIFDRFSAIPNVTILGRDHKERLGVVAFTVTGAHYNLIVKLLNDKFGVQTRGGCSCAGTYGHHLLQVDEEKSLEILNAIRSGNMLSKPGWVRLSIHPTMSNSEIELLMEAIALTAAHFREWQKEYTYDVLSNEYTFNGAPTRVQKQICTAHLTVT